MKVKLGIYLPVYGGWLRNVPIEEEEISYKYLKRCALKAEESGIDSVWIPDHLLNPIKGEKNNKVSYCLAFPQIAIA